MKTSGFLYQHKRHVDELPFAEGAFCTAVTKLLLCPPPEAGLSGNIADTPSSSLAHGPKAGAYFASQPQSPVKAAASVVPPSATALHRNRRGFSLVEVVLALGIFGFAMVAILGLLSTTNNNTRQLLDSDAALTAWPSLRQEIRSLPRATIEGIPEGTTGGPRMFMIFKPEESGAGMRAVVRNGDVPEDVADSQDGRLYRVTLQRALDGNGSPSNWSPGRASYPLRVTLEVFQADANPDTAQPRHSQVLHTAWNIQ
jgi:Tfp pilus assembly protein PilV